MKILNAARIVTAAIFLSGMLFPAFSSARQADTLSFGPENYPLEYGEYGYAYRNLKWREAGNGISVFSFKDTVRVVSATERFAGWEDRPMKMAYVEVRSGYDPLNPVDTALAPSARWFDLVLSGVKDTEVVFDFFHTDPLRPFYSFDGTDYHRFSGSSEKMTGADGEEVFRTRQFFDRDTVRISYFIPYTCRRLEEKVAEWKRSEHVRIGTIGKAASGLDMPLLHITDFSETGKKLTIYIHGRIHTSEAPSSWHLEAMIDRLSDPEDAFAAALRRHIDFYVVPFANPDGVAYGLSRSNLSGVNQEINYARSGEQTAVEVANIKAFLERLTSGRNVDLALNMHSQCGDFVTYWVHDAASTSDGYFEELMRFASLTADSNPYFRISEFSYSAVAPRYVEGWFWDRFGEKVPALTFETPYTYYGQNPVWLTPENLAELADHSLTAIADFFCIPVPGRQTVQVGSGIRKTVRLKVLPDAGSFRNPEEGDYVLYGWPAYDPSDPEGQQWRNLGKCILKRGKFRLKIPRGYGYVQIRRK